jgi:hypothetical protein
VYARFRYLDGAVEGRTRVAPTDFVTIGRHPGSDVPFDPDADLEVSVRHAAVFRQGGGFMVRDLGSTNGTYLNGRPVRGDRPLEPNDVLRFGPTGPRLEFSVVPTLPKDATRVSASPPASPAAPRRTRPTDRVLASPRPRSPRWRWVAGSSALAIILAASQVTRRTRAGRDALETQRAALLARADDLLGRLEQARSPARGVTGALVRARREVGALRASIAASPAATASLDPLTRELVRQVDRQDDVLRAAAFDPTAAADASGPAVAVVVADLPGGRVVSGTGFALRAAGDTVWIVTARHLVRDSAGLAATRVALVFSGRGRTFPATIERVHDSLDLALLATRVRGAVPVIKGIADSVAAGDAVAMVGYPAGLDSLGRWRAGGVTATAAVATVTEVGAQVLAINGYGTLAASGGPILDPTGEVVGVVTGSGGADPERPVVYALPGRVVRDLLGTRDSALGPRHSAPPSPPKRSALSR